MILLEFIDTLLEEGPRIQHPEDAIFTSASMAQQAVDALKDVIDDPGSVSIKWDGGVALFFGNKDGKFVMSDKYMPNKGVYPDSPKGWVEYDQARGANRGNLYQQIETIWNGLKAAVGNTEGLFKGDLMWVGRLQPVKGQYVFKPTTVEYRVPVNSDIGDLIAGKVGGVVVHSYNGAPWDGETGISNADSNVLVLAPKAGINFTLKSPVRLISAAEKAVAQDGPKAEEFLSGMPNVVRAKIQTFFNKQITGQTKDKIQDWLATQLSGKQQVAMLDPENGYLFTNADGLNALYNVWNSVNNFKVHLAQQLEQQVSGFEQWTGGKKEGEGFVFNSKIGLIKIVNRAGFGGAHFNK